MKKTFSMVMVIFLLILLVGFIVYLVYPWPLIIGGFNSLPNPPPPEITYGEFPFKLVYEVNGEEKIVEDIIICEYDGIAAGSNGKWRKWKKYLANNHDEGDILLKVEGDKKICYSVGDADYYMGDAGEYAYLKDYDYHQFPNAFYKEPNSMRGISYGGIDADELLDKYGIKLISWEPSPPIKNTFK